MHMLTLKVCWLCQQEHGITLVLVSGIQHILSSCLYSVADISDGLMLRSEHILWLRSVYRYVILNKKRPVDDPEPIELQMKSATSWTEYDYPGKWWSTESAVGRFLHWKFSGCGAIWKAENPSSTWWCQFICSHRSRRRNVRWTGPAARSDARRSCRIHHHRRGTVVAAGPPNVVRSKAKKTPRNVGLCW